MLIFLDFSSMVTMIDVCAVFAVCVARIVIVVSDSHVVFGLTVCVEVALQV